MVYIENSVIYMAATIINQSIAVFVQFQHFGTRTAGIVKYGWAITFGDIKDRFSCDFL